MQRNSYISIGCHIRTPHGCSVTERVQTAASPSDRVTGCTLSEEMRPLLWEPAFSGACVVLFRSHLLETFFSLTSVAETHIFRSLQSNSIYCFNACSQSYNERFISDLTKKKKKKKACFCNQHWSEIAGSICFRGLWALFPVNCWSDITTTLSAVYACELLRTHSETQ